MEKEFLKKYSGALELLLKRTKDRRDRGILTAMGYTSNLDILCDFDVNILNDLLEKESDVDDPGRLKPAKIITSGKDLAETMAYFCINGIGGEVDIENTGEVTRAFNCKNGMGGTAVQAALALAEVGGDSLVHLTDDSKEVCDLLRSPCIYVPGKDGELYHTDSVSQSNEQELHFIIQFQKGDIVRIRDREYEIPVSNRLILTKITVNETVPFNDDYFRWIEDNASRVSSNVLSSFNCILDPDVLMDRIRYVKAHVDRYHKANPESIVYYEDAHYHDREIRKTVLESICPVVDIAGMNEEELSYTLKEMYGRDLDKGDIRSCIEGVEYLIDKLSIRKGVVIHTKDYGMYVGEHLDADIESGLIFGNILATAKAANGWYGSVEDIDRILKYDLSPGGASFKDEVEKAGYSDRVVIVPSRYIDKPKYTIGLGDSFVGGLQMCF